MLRLFRPLIALHIALIFTLVFVFPLSASAKCCSCAIDGKAVCLTDPPKDDCSGLKDNVADLKGVTCTDLGDAQCKTPAEAPNSGACTGGKQAAVGYKKDTSGITGKIEIIPPILNVQIPGLEFGSSRSVEIATKGAVGTDGKISPGGIVEINFFAQYVSALIKYAIGISVVVASIMLVYGGFLYVVGATAGNITTGKETIKNSLVGLVLLLSSYTILQTLNPMLISLRPLTIQVVAPGLFERERQLSSNSISLEDCTKNPNSIPLVTPSTCSDTRASAEVRAAANKVQAETGVPAFLMMGIISIESAFNEQACPYNNCAGIKCYPPPSNVSWVPIGQTINCGDKCALIKTKEDLHDGKGQIEVMACFQKFDPPPPGKKWEYRFQHVARILRGKHYDRPGFSWRNYQDNPTCMAKFMQKSGYATATNYYEVMQKNFKTFCIIP